MQPYTENQTAIKGIKYIILQGGEADCCELCPKVGDGVIRRRFEVA